MTGEQPMDFRKRENIDSTPDRQCFIASMLQGND
jgi:hypothetical protein